MQIVAQVLISAILSSFLGYNLQKSETLGFYLQNFKTLGFDIPIIWLPHKQIMGLGYKMKKLKRLGFVS